MVEIVVMFSLSVLSACAFVDSLVEDEYAESAMWLGASIILFMLTVISVIYGYNS